MLLFKKKFLPLIRAGVKRQTIRVWQRRQMKDGQRSYIPGIGEIFIVSVTAVDLEELTETDASADGFLSLELLKEELTLLYAVKIEQGFHAYRVVFRLPHEIG